MNYKSARISVLCAVVAISSACHTSAQSVPRATGDIQPMHTERYTFRIDGKTIGTQYAALADENGKTQTWSFSLNLKMPMNGQTVSMDQVGAVVLTKDAHPVTLETTLLTNGVKHHEALTFADRKVTTCFDPPIAAIAHTFPVAGHPYLLINNLVTLLSIETQAARGEGKTPLTLPLFSANTLQPVALTLTPAGTSTYKSKPCHDFDVAPIGEVVRLDDATGAIVMLFDDKQKLEIAKD